ncbi:MAG: hypothetical protein ACFFG0_46220 [Candidatus Thorarchaeota archaeon]
MVEYRRVMGINCKPTIKGWDCDITRILSDEPKEINNNVCFITKTESEKDLESVHLEKDSNTCIVQEGAKGNFMRCEKR